MSTIDLVVTDLDGTLWHGREVLHPTTASAWHELERRGSRSWWPRAGGSAPPGSGSPSSG